MSERANMIFAFEKTREYSAFSLTKRILFFDKSFKKTRKYSAFLLTERILFFDNLKRKREDTMFFH